MKIIQDCLTEDDNKTYCGMKVMSFISLFAFLLYAAYELYTTKNIHLDQFANGLMNVGIGSGVSIGGKQATAKTPVADNPDAPQ